jgi:hypothetical protein
MTPSPKDTEPMLDGQAARATFRDFVQEQVRQAIGFTIGATAGLTATRTSQSWYGR